VFLEYIIPLLKRDSYESFSKEVYKTAIKLVTKEQPDSATGRGS